MDRGRRKPRALIHYWQKKQRNKGKMRRQEGVLREQRDQHKCNPEAKEAEEQEMGGGRQADCHWGGRRLLVSASVDEDTAWPVYPQIAGEGPCL